MNGRTVDRGAAARLLLGGLVVLLACASVPLTVLAHDPWPSNDGLTLALALVFAAVGFVVLRRDLRNPVAWILLADAAIILFETDVRLYLVLDYRLHGGRLPLGSAAVYWTNAYTLLPILVGLPVIALFPDGRLPTRRWRRALAVYAAFTIVFMAGQFAGAAIMRVPSHVQIDIRGVPSSTGNTTVAGLVWVLIPLFLAFWISFVVRQIRRWRHANGEQRQQLKWLMSGGAVCVLCCITIVLFGDGSTTGARVAADLSTVGIAALPVGIGVGILKYRLYEIDRLVSRTLSYAVLTAVLAGVFVGIVVLTTDVLPFSSPVGVAASTLASAALRNPLRLRLQRLVDRRFNRARYDAEATVAAFTARLRDAVDLDTTRLELLDVVNRAVAPSHASVWIRPPQERRA